MTIIKVYPCRFHRYMKAMDDLHSFVHYTLAPRSPHAPSDSVFLPLMPLQCSQPTFVFFEWFAFLCFYDHFHSNQKA
uniref:Uncharacterized protein n=1 Tax=Lepeophtheirus salmonis TaxID=72036 RepID=A0A0K2TV27_LEPSM